MPIITKSKQVTNETLRMLKAKSMGERPMDEPLHASDVYACERKTVASRIFGTPPKSRKDIEIMFPGFAIQEYCWGEEADGETWEGMIYSVDGETSDGAVLEMKTTGAYSTYLVDPKPDWIERTRAYCAIRGEVTGKPCNEAYITVYSFTSRVFVEWHIQYSEKELAKELKWLRKQIPKLQKFIKRGVLPPVTTRRYDWECLYCPFYGHEDVDCKPLLKLAGMTKTVRKEKK